MFSTPGIIITQGIGVLHSNCGFVKWLTVRLLLDGAVFEARRDFCVSSGIFEDMTLWE
ncbi:hypothetical protein JOB18_040337 [Solea senegalensis]|uniref:Uncharacterized protein n=1 Tax=Solea senegalensis TaxID=28829 RepID=A0AAV6RLQ6_SOLSE|nr:hypothetical protein JOB18_040337 [Solea senegalensis]